jgi:hypothetical protein
VGDLERNVEMSEDKTLGVLDRILSYVDSPFKLIALLIMFVFGFCAWFVYANHDLLVGAYKESQKLPSINEARVEDAAAVLIKYGGAQTVSIFKVNPLFGTRVLYRAYTKDGRDKRLEGVDVGLFTTNQANNADVVRLMAGETPCSDYAKPQSEVGLWYVEAGVTYGCRISVPPDHTRFIGQITVGFKDRPESIEDVQSMLGIASSMLTKKSY